MSTIQKNIRSGIFYTALSKYSNVFSSIFISAVLARLLTPTEFGTVAIVMVFISFFNLLSNLGLGPAIIQNKTLTKNDIESLFLFSIFVGITFSIIFFLSAPFIAGYYESPELNNLSKLMSLIILFQALRIVPEALNRKQLKFKYIGIIQVVVQILGGIIAIILAYAGFSYYALVINAIFSSFLTFIAFYYLEPVKLVFKMDFISIGKIFKFSSFQFFFSFINYFSRNADNLLIGKFFGLSLLGFYDKAYRLMMMPVQNLTHVITPVLHPVLSNYQDDKKVIYNAYTKVVKLLATIGFPLSVFLYFNAPEIINIIFGSQWQESIPVFRLLALTVSIQIVLSSTGSIFQATNRTDLMFYSGIIGTVLLLSGISYGIFWGRDLVSVGYGLMIAFTLNFLQALFLLIKKAMGFPYFSFLKIFIYPLIIGVSVGLVLYFTQSIIPNNIFLSLLTKGFMALLVFIGVSSLSKDNRNLFKEYIWKRNKPFSGNNLS